MNTYQNTNNNYDDHNDHDPWPVAVGGPLHGQKIDPTKDTCFGDSPKPEGCCLTGEVCDMLGDIRYHCVRFFHKSGKSFTVYLPNNVADTLAKDERHRYTELVDDLEAYITQCSGCVNPETSRRLWDARLEQVLVEAEERKKQAAEDARDEDVADILCTAAEEIAMIRGLSYDQTDELYLHLVGHPLTK